MHSGLSHAAPHLPRRAKLPMQKLNGRFLLQRARKHLRMWSSASIFNQAQSFLDLAENILDARIAVAKSDRTQAISYWDKAVEVQDKLYYGEPPEWFYPVRESLGAALLWEATLSWNQL